MRMKMTNWKRNSRRAARRANVGQRALAGLLALVVILGLAHFSQPTAKSASGSAKDYATEQKTRIEGYSDKFNLGKLEWKDNSARTYMCWKKDSATFGGIEHKNYIHVFAFEGETICFGSSVAKSTLGVSGTDAATAEEKAAIERRFGTGATIDIVLEDLDGNRIAYDVAPNGAGHIPDYQTEVLAKTMESVSGNSSAEVQAWAGGTVITGYTYTPLTYSVHETGVYTFEFHSQDGAGFADNKGNTRKNKNDIFSNIDTGVLSEADCGGMVDAWDISVFNEQGYKETGRVYADYLDFQEKGDVNETYYVLTSDNYIYQWDFKKAHPYTYNFFANNQGLLEKGTDHILYKSVKDLKNDNKYDKFGVTYTYPGTPDTELTKSYKIFFEMPDGDLMGHLYDKAVAPDPAFNLKFVTEVWDEDKKDYIPGTYVGRGGWFQFEVENATTATLRIEFQGKLTGMNYAPVEISQVVTPYSVNRFFWDGRDGNGVIIPAGDYTLVDLSWTVTTKAGEIHFPIVDVEDTAGGFTFTRVSPVYDKNGNRIDADEDEINGAKNNIYTATRSVIYYDNSAIYYGEKVARAGTPESDIETVVNAKKSSSKSWADSSWDGTDTNKKTYQEEAGLFYLWDDIKIARGSEYKAWRDEYRQNKNLRAGDHSHISNDITFYKEDGTLIDESEITKQQEMITWLDSAENPVSISGGTGTTTVSDFSIQNFWTFVPGQPVKAKGESEEKIVIRDLPKDKQVANITGLVFYDNDATKTNGTHDGIYNNSQSDMDVPLSGVRVNLYRQTDDTVKDTTKTYYTVTGEHGNWRIAPYTGDLPAASSTVFELVKPTATTDLTGRVIFENQLYDAAKGTKFIYEVIKTYPNWKLTSGGVKGQPLGSSPNQYGNYALYAYDGAEFGTEIQVFTLADDAKVPEAVNPEKNKANYENHTATAIDVGYHYTPVQSLKASKSWKTTGSEKTPSNVVFELSYYMPKATGEKTKVYEVRSLSSIMSWENVWNYLPDKIGGNDVQYYISAEYYLVENPDGGGRG